MRSIANYTRIIRAHIPRTIHVIVVGLRRTEQKKSSFRATKKGRKKNYSVSQNFAQLTKKTNKLEKALKKSGKKGKRRHYKGNFNSE